MAASRASRWCATHTGSGWRAEPVLFSWPSCRAQRVGRLHGAHRRVHAMLMASAASPIAFQAHVMSLATFQKITDALVAAGRIKRRSDAYPAELGIKTKLSRTSARGGNRT